MIEGIFSFVFGDHDPVILTHRKNIGEQEIGGARLTCVKTTNGTGGSH